MYSKLLVKARAFFFQKKSTTGEGVGREGVEENPGLNYQYIYIYIYIYIYMT